MTSDQEAAHSPTCPFPGRVWSFSGLILAFPLDFLFSAHGCPGGLPPTCPCITESPSLCLPIPDKHGVRGGPHKAGGPLPADGGVRWLLGLQPRGVDRAAALLGGVLQQCRTPALTPWRPAGDAGPEGVPRGCGGLEAANWWTHTAEEEGAEGPCGGAGPGGAAAATVHPLQWWLLRAQLHPRQCRLPEPGAQDHQPSGQAALHPAAPAPDVACAQAQARPVLPAAALRAGCWKGRRVLAKPEEWGWAEGHTQILLVQLFKAPLV